MPRWTLSRWSIHENRLRCSRIPHKDNLESINMVFADY